MSDQNEEKYEEEKNEGGHAHGEAVAPRSGPTFTVVVAKRPEPDQDQREELRKIAPKLREEGEEPAAAPGSGPTVTIVRQDQRKTQLRQIARKLHEEGYALYETPFPGHLVAALAKYEESLTVYERLQKLEVEVGVGTAIREITAHQIATAFSDMADVFRGLKNFPRALEYYDRALPILTRVLGEEDANIASLHKNMAIVCHEQGYDLRALEHNERALSISAQVLGPRHPTVVQVLTNMAGMFYDQRDFSGALKHLQLALEIQVDALGERHPGNAKLLLKMGNAFSDNNDDARALDHYERAISITAENLGERHPEVALILRNMASIFEDKAEYRLALEHLEAARSILVDAFGERHRAVANTLFSLSRVYSKQGDYAQALEFCERSLTIDIEGLGERHIDVAEKQCALAHHLTREGDHVRALEFYERALSIQAEKLGRHPTVANTLHNIALLHNVQGDVTRGLQMDELALSINIAALGERHESVAKSLSSMGDVYAAQGEYALALEHMERARSIVVEIFGERHPRVANALSGIALTNMKIGNFDEALRCAFLGLDMRLELVGDSHADVGLSRLFLAMIFEESGNYVDALSQARAAAAIFFRTRGSYDSKTRGCKAMASKLAGLIGDEANSTDTPSGVNIPLPSEALADLPRRRPSGVIQGRPLSSNDGREVHRILFNGDLYALKTVPAVEFRMFEREVEAMRSCDHPNVARVLDFGRDGPRAWFRQELFSNDLAQVIDERAARARDGSTSDGYFRASEIHEIALNVVRAMHYLHDVQSLAHCDMKTAQYLVDTDDVGRVVRVVLTDFGIAQPGRRGLSNASPQGAGIADHRKTSADSNDDASRALSEDADLQNALGYTPGWTAPEVVANFEDQVNGHPGRAFDAFAADIFALCLVLHHLVTGESFDRNAGRGNNARRCNWTVSALPRLPYVSYPCPNDGPASEKVVTLLSAITTVHAGGLKKNPGDRLTVTEALSIMTAAPFPEDNDELYDEIVRSDSNVSNSVAATSAIPVGGDDNASLDIPAWLEKVGLFGFDDDFPVLTEYSVPTLHGQCQETLASILASTKRLLPDDIASGDARGDSSTVALEGAEELFSALHFDDASDHGRKQAREKSEANSGPVNPPEKSKANTAPVDVPTWLEKVGLFGFDDDFPVLVDSSLSTLHGYSQEELASFLARGEGSSTLVLEGAEELFSALHFEDAHKGREVRNGDVDEEAKDTGTKRPSKMLPGEELRDTALKLHAEARDLVSSDQLAAIAKYQRSLEIFELVLELMKAVGGSQEALSGIHVGTVLTDIGDMFRDKGEYARALDNYERAFSIKVKSKGERFKGVADTLDSMAVMFNKQGEKARALEHFERALSIKTEADVMPMYPNVSFTLSCMAKIFKDQGEFPRAMEHFQRALSIKVDALGEQDPRVLVTLNDMAEVLDAWARVLQGQKEYANALKQYEMALSFKIRALGEHNTDVAFTLNGMACMLSDQGEYTRSLECFERVLAIYIETFGEQHQSVVNTHTNIAHMFFDQKEYGRSLQHFARVLSINVKMFGDVHPSVAQTLGKMSGVFEHQGDYVRALEHLERVLSIKLAALGERHERHPGVAGTLSDMADLLIKTGELGRALEHYERALAIKVKAFGDRHPELANTFHKMAGTYLKLGNTEDASRCAVLALDIRVEHFEETDVRVGRSRMTLAEILEKEDEFQGALLQARAAAAILVRQLGPDHAGVLQCNTLVGRLEEELQAEESIVRNDTAAVIKD
jgi:tetratricopeptide (TPR) repeat protein/serine/threonine protein kinase